MFDEFQHFAERESFSLNRTVSDWTKNFMNETRKTLILFGTPKSEEILDGKENGQLRRRFPFRMRLEPFNWKNKEGKSNFRKFLQIIDERLPLPKPAIENFLPLRISNLFFFDGEKIESLANEKQSAEFLSAAIRSLLGIDLIDKLSTDLIVLQRRKKSPVKQVDITWKIEELEKEIENLDYEISETEVKNNLLKEEVNALEIELEEIENQLRFQGGDLFEKHKEVESAKKSAEEKIREVNKYLLDLASGLSSLLIVSNLLEEIALQNSIESRVLENEIINKIMIQRDKDLIEDFRSKNNKKLQDLTTYELFVDTL